MKNVIKSQLSRYLSKELSKEMLYQWAIGLLHEMLKGDMLKINYLEIWGIVTELAGIEDIEDTDYEESVQRFLRILSGEENASFTFAMKIPEKFVVKNLSNIGRILEKHAMGGQLSLDEIKDLKFVINQRIGAFHTLNELLEVQIIDLLKWGYGLCIDEENIIFEPKSTVFMCEAEEAPLEKNVLTTLIALLECYEGRRCFFVHINFMNGVSNISVQT